ncbi:beta-galactosidase [Cohnella fermenti]|uniref:beta-galactosidase n=1 Tax=Cohnella fermenti TaxID=2565925 RepID=A0A4S4BYK9_9BACL|nr:beta-galactosidase [Cohnella fermenti]THF80354.1 beta-galactosidase [Cohnella fermenti]
MGKTLREETVRLGVCYYPEHWEEELWEDDFRRMRELGFSIVRMAEFAWAYMEPEEGTFRFELFDRALDAAHRYGLKVILGTPTATPPAWLTQKYPEVLNGTRDGTLYRHGMRRHTNYNSPVYRELCGRITRKMAEHFKDHPAVVGWQIDNELNCESNEFYSSADHAAFREWLQRKYGSLEALNEAWGAVFWSQTYTEWEQVHLSRPTPANSPNPHLMLDEKRFISDSAIGFARIQADILREVAGGKQWITTNGMFGHLDNHRMTEELLDFYTYDSYPQFAAIHPDEGPNPFLDRMSSWHLSNVRSISPNYGIMEQQSGPGGWVNRMAMPSPKPGQMRLWTYQSIAHGADMVLYFRWRTATFGTEIYWHGINDYHNRPNRRVREAGRIGEELGRVGGRIAQSRYEASIAIVSDYDNAWDGEFDSWHGPLTARSTKAWFKALQREHIAVDSLTLTERTTLDELRRYKALVYPHPAILTEQTAELLRAYAEAGGAVLFGARTGYKDERGHCRMLPMPGFAASLCGVTVEDFTMVNGIAKAPALRWTAEAEDADKMAGGKAGVGGEGSGAGEGDSGEACGEQSGVALSAAAGESITADGFNDILRVESGSVKVLAEYASDYYAGAPALTVNELGEGRVFYYGAAYNEAVVGRLLPLLGLRKTAAGLLTAPPEVELAVRRQAAGEACTFALNYSADTVTLRLHRSAVDLPSGRSLAGDVELEPYGVLVLQEQ